MGNIAIVSATDETYLVLFEDMLRSLGDNLSAFGLVVMDLGLTDRGKERIRSKKSDVHFLKPDWHRDFRGRDKILEYNKVFLSKPFIPDMFPGTKVMSGLTQTYGSRMKTPSRTT